MNEPVRVGLAGEDQAHRLLLERLSDMVLCERLAIAPENVAPLRVFCGDPEGSSPFFPTSDATDRLRRRRQGRPLYRSRRIGAAPAGEAFQIEDTVSCMELAPHPPDALLILVDEDGGADKARTIAEVNRDLQRRAGRIRLVLVGLCVPTAEGWLIPLIAPGLPPARMKAIRDALSFSPERTPEKLCSKPLTSPRHVKRVLNAMLSDEPPTPLDHHSAATPKGEDTSAALSAAPADLPALRRLDGCGLGDFLALLGARYLPLFSLP